MKYVPLEWDKWRSRLEPKKKSRRGLERPSSKKKKARQPLDNKAMVVIVVDVNMTEGGQLFILGLSLLITVGSVVHWLTSLFFLKTSVQVLPFTFFLAPACLFIYSILMVHTSYYWVLVLSTFVLWTIQSMLLESLPQRRGSSVTWQSTRLCWQFSLFGTSLSAQRDYSRLPYNR